MEYSDAHRAFLQILLQHRILAAKDVKITYEKVCNKFDVQPPSLRDFVVSINEKLEDLHMAIRKTIQEEEERDVHCFVLINNLNNEVTREFSSFTKLEMTFLKSLVEALLTTDDGYINETSVINLGSDRKCRMNASATECLIDRLVEGKYLLRSNGRISLGSLTLCELQTYIEDNFSESCVKCFFCKHYTFKGYACPECGVRGHRLCLHNYWKEIKKSPCCPNTSCGAQFEEVEQELCNKRSRTDRTEEES